ncbi:UDP-glucose 4-epimerase GalE [Fictibacillus sp. 26RED30]|jgi:UDP-glucose 4-epimerase|uniref:UDP-glucose 4-epimerase GalE n=1 Tax=Fictibacillus sp. 26RED30 TaxID=2745877 RepID=UPI0018CE5A97|nr:UDP-glucose 4-epimerase GalE [Fictibacillus sp. 26RED30]MBH0161735.1 UDP-glucose 4-epimerase GalE [Fictibacillus sp. 26RED30]
MAILVTGGAGYIGSHTVVELLNTGYEVVVVDSFVNSDPDVINRIQSITGKELKSYNANLLDKERVTQIFSENKIDAVIHFAGLKAVGESVEKPLYYYHNNIAGSLILAEVMKDFGVKKMVFSSSATVYGTAETVPLEEDTPLGATNPYGWTKLMLEQIYKDLFVSDNEWSIALLRYFNPVGAHESGLIGEDPSGIPNNLTPFITQVAVGKLEKLRVFGNDYDTHDGTGVRDYIHVVDLAKGHLKALDKVLTNSAVEAYNLGTGKGYSVLDMVKTFESVTGIAIPYEVSDRRPGDIAVSYADPTKAREELGWKAELTLEDMLRDSWNWQEKSKDGFKGN